MLEIIDKGMKCLIDNMGVVEAEEFISVINREKLNYTKWQREFYDAMKQGEFHKNAVGYAKIYPYNGKATRL